MSRTHHCIAGFICICSLLQSTPTSADDAQGKLAIISGKGEKAEIVADLLSVEFSKADGIELVERDRINAVVKELNLNAAGLVNPGERARLGAIVAADVVLFVEQEAKVQPPLLHISAVESRTGVNLFELQLPTTDVDAVTSTAVKGTREALSRARTQVESRLFIAFTGIRSEEPGSYLLPTAQALTAFMRQDLHRTPGVFLLERSRLQHLTAERDLTGFDLILKASALLADAGIRRKVGGGGYDVTVRVSSLDGQPVRTNSIEIASPDLLVVRRELHAALISALGAAGADAQPESAVQEARAFARHAAWLGAERDLEEAICAAESAFALDPKPEHCQLLHRLLYSLVRRHTSRIGSTHSVNLAERRATVRQTLFEALIPARRCHELDLWWIPQVPERNRYYATMGVNGNPFEPHVPRNHPEDPDKEPPMAAEPPEMRDLRDEYDQLRQQKFRLLVNRADGDPDVLGRLAIHELRQVDYFASDAADYVKRVLAIQSQLDQCIDELNRRAGPHDAGTAAFLRSENVQKLAEQLKWTCKNGWTTARVHPQWTAPELLPLWTALLEHGQPEVAALGCVALCQLEDHRDRAVRRGLEVLPHVKGFGAELCSHIRNHLQSTSALEQVLEDLVSKAEADDDPKLLAERPFLIFTLLATIGGEKRDWLQRMTALTAREVSPDTPWANLSTRFKAQLDHYQQQTLPKPMAPGGLRLSGAWEEYTVAEIRPNRILKDGQVLAVLPVASAKAQTGLAEVIALYSGKWSTLDIGSLSLQDGTVRALGKCSYDSKVQRSVVAAADPTNLFIATGKPGLAWMNLATRTVEEFESKDGYLGTAVSSMACVGGKLYYLSEALCEFDPATRHFRLLASPSAAANRGPFDGRGNFSIRSLLGDDDHDSVWFSSSASERRGIWKYVPATNQFALVFDAANSTRISTPIWNEGSIIFFVVMRLPTQDYAQRVRKLLAAENLMERDFSKLTPEQLFSLTYDRQLMKLDPASGVVEELADYGNLELSDNRFLLVGDHVVRPDGTLVAPGGTLHNLYLDNRWTSIFPIVNGFVSFRLSPEDEHLLVFQRKSHSQ